MSCYSEGMASVLKAAGIKHFSASEVARVGRRANGHGPALAPPPPELWSNAVPTLRVLDELRAKFGPVTVVSGYRDPAYNKAVGGAPESLHLTCNAFDIRVHDVAPAEVYHWLSHHEEASRMGLGVYPSFVHVDTRAHLGRPAPARW